MNYRNDILENKAFSFFKQLMYNIALGICIILVAVLILTFGFKFKLSKVESDSEAPNFYRGDMVVTKAQKEYKVGDIIQFLSYDDKGRATSVTHRLIGIVNDGGTDYYICHGDNVQPANPEKTTDTVPWREDADYIKSLIDQGKSITEIKSLARNLQTPKYANIEGKVLASARHYGTYVEFIKTHYMLFITLLLGIWCVSYTVQNEIEYKRMWRVM